ncbi:uncharacterized protein LOC120293715 [Eucalyptus grandis]|uniref:uncharacterized protein LOC120293715 n=1 Tax=Eucalyptus grandis TaxID=71139 RepID=UPI00192E8B0C|nr:uncharacterized protein LOC120293715 [Eucalyptus grandis]
MRNALLVVSTLITSTTYQSVLQPPCFSSNVDPNSNKVFLAPSTFVSSHAEDVIYTVFMTGNTFGLFMSVQMIVCLTRDLPLKLPLRLCLHLLHAIHDVHVDEQRVTPDNRAIVERVAAHHIISSSTDTEVVGASYGFLLGRTFPAEPHK